MYTTENDFTFEELTAEPVLAHFADCFFCDKPIADREDATAEVINGKAHHICPTCVAEAAELDREEAEVLAFVASCTHSEVRSEAFDDGDGRPGRWELLTCCGCGSELDHRTGEPVPVKAKPFVSALTLQARAKEAAA